jgi:hypothetical protein
VPVVLLSIATVVSAVLGLSLSHGASTPPSIADQLGCQKGTSSQPQAGVEQETCSYHGDTIVILTLSKGPHALYPPLLPDTFVMGSSGNATAWVVGCPRRDDCVTIRQQLGGDLTSGPMLGLSLVVG